MNDDLKKEILYIADNIHGEINRMCVTRDITEYVAMYEYSKRNLDLLFKLIFESKFENRG